MTAPEELRKRLPGGWQYGRRDTVAALRLAFLGLRLDLLDDLIETLQQAGSVEGVRLWERQRAELLRLLTLDATGRAAEDKARKLAGLIREGSASADTELGKRGRQAQSNRRKGRPGTSEAPPDRNELLKRHFDRLVQSGHPGPQAAAAAAVGLSTRQARRILTGK